MKCRKITACLLALLMTCSAVASCTGGGTSDVTATGTDTGSATESATVAATDRATDTERGSESESETAPIPAVKENVPTSGASVTFYHNENNSLFLTAEGLDAAVTEDAEVGTVLSLRAAGGSEHTLTLNYGEYVRAHGLEPATVGGRRELQMGGKAVRRGCFCRHYAVAVPQCAGTGRDGAPVFGHADL